MNIRETPEIVHLISSGQTKRGGRSYNSSTGGVLIRSTVRLSAGSCPMHILEDHQDRMPAC
jgi:hypothetical protein